jgi:two-component system, cell cycle response regulator
MIVNPLRANNPLLVPAAPARILAVDDDLMAIRFLANQITGLGHIVLKAGNGQEALTLLESERIDVVLMDREMPVMDGLTAVRRMKDSPRLRHIPVVMVTSADSAAEMREGMEAGVFYYLAKPVEEEQLRSVLSAAVRDAAQTRTLTEELEKHRASFGLIETCRFQFRTLPEAESLAAFMANCFPDPRRVLPGLGELLINAIEHGNLGLGYARKTALIDSGAWRAEVERLQASPEHAGKTATATIAHKPDGIYVSIEDQGEGFAWQKYMRIDPARAGDNHGRGIAQANAVSFDRLAYAKNGTQAVAFVGRESKLEW